MKKAVEFFSWPVFEFSTMETRKIGHCLSEIIFWKTSIDGIIMLTNVSGE